VDLGLVGKRVVITGASRGIGRACAEAFAREGALLHLVARSADALAAARTELAASHKTEATIQVLDIAVPGAADAMFAACPNADILINNAGGILRGDLLQLEGDAWRQAWELKVFGYIGLTQRFYRAMTERGAGVILNIIGIAAEKHQYEYAAGSTGNAALAAFTRTIGSESLDRGVRVLGVNPGWVDTTRGVPLMQRYAQQIFGTPDRWREVIGTWGLKRFIRAGEVADVVVFLASDRASAVCGEVLNVDLGFGSRNYHIPAGVASRT
jgi:NAD(P)-dependent dehydrogenase (short-subunit alcohol dehydrogenase family)